MKGVSPLRRSPRLDHIMEELVWVETMWDLWDHAQIGTGDAEDMKHHHEMVINSIRCVGDFRLFAARSRLRTRVFTTMNAGVVREDFSYGLWAVILRGGRAYVSRTPIGFQGMTVKGGVGRVRNAGSTGTARARVRDCAVAHAERA